MSFETLPEPLGAPHSEVHQTEDGEDPHEAADDAADEGGEVAAAFFHGEVGKSRTQSRGPTRDVRAVILPAAVGDAPHRTQLFAFNLAVSIQALGRQVEGLSRALHAVVAMPTVDGEVDPRRGRHRGDPAQEGGGLANVLAHITGDDGVGQGC